MTDALANRLLDAMWSPAWGGLPYWIDLGVTQSTVLKAMLLAVFSAGVAAIVPALRVTGKRVQHNIQRARALLAEAGHPNGVTIQCFTSQREDYSSIMLMIQEQL